MTSLSGIETTFGLDLLNSIEFQEPFVFSPVSLLFALALLGRDGFNSTVLNTYTKYGFRDPDVYNYLKKNLSEIVVRGDSGVNDVRRNTTNQSRILFNGVWESEMPLKRAGVFYPTTTTSKQIVYLKNERHVLLNVDDQFKMISIPYDDWNLQFFVLLPAKSFNLKKALKKLTKARFEKLHQDATIELVHIMIPKFDILQLLINSKNMGLQPPIKTSLKYKHSPRVAGMLYRPENREPYFFKADNPFAFGVLRNGRPVYLGIYS
ncbi:hypothetical protein GCK72_025225 [Caenorhabditis remanei]|uniref:Serpin domain-containing protein n=1 Tax=Caenorhabditis remanei TaxID=31234 RepID=A0A6A5G1E4_CAERE|nr:hypothetical protein GCK72_025225 [Caenorhabditis remanei]KAF1748758.1 hypothetical protein GCK72_025225 [Caenorhabditis remanei]